MGNQIKLNLVKQAERQTCLLAVLRAIIKDQTMIGLLDKEIRYMNRYTTRFEENTGLTTKDYQLLYQKP